MSFIKEKLQWLRQQMADGSLLYFNTEEDQSIDLRSVDIYTSYQGDHLVANGNWDITDVSIFGYNPNYQHGMRYPIWNDSQLYVSDYIYDEEEVKQ